MFIQNVFGHAAGPFIAGALSDSYGLAAALAMVPMLCVPAALLYLVSARFYARDLDRTEKVAITPAGSLSAAAARMYCR